MTLRILGTSHAATLTTLIFFRKRVLVPYILRKARFIRNDFWKVWALRMLLMSWVCKPR